VPHGRGEALRSFMTTTNAGDETKMGWKYTCCKFPTDNMPTVYREGPCFLSSITELDENMEEWTVAEKRNNMYQILMTQLSDDRGAACGPGEALTSWAVRPCGNQSSNPKYDTHSHFVWECVPIGGIPSPPPPAPPPPIDDSFQNLDWVGDFSATAKIAFGDDVDNATLSKALGIIKVAGEFDITEGEFTMNKLDIRAAIEFKVPAKPGSWQEGQSLNELEITGFAVITYPCSSMVDPFTGDTRAIALIYGEVRGKLAMGDEADPMMIGGVNGARGIVQYSCFGGQKLEVKLEVGMVKMKTFRLEDILINVTLVSNPSGNNDVAAWFVAGSIEGKVAPGSRMNTAGADQKQVAAASGAFIFDSSVPFFDLAYKHEFGGPFDDFYLALMFRVTRGRCSRQGDYVKGVIKAKGADWNLAGSLQGSTFCANPEDATAIRHNLTLTVDQLSFADGMLNMSHAAVIAVGRAPYRSPEDVHLAMADWKLTVTADVTVDVAAGSDFAFKVRGAAELVLDMEAREPAETTMLGSPGFTLSRARIDSTVALSYRGDGFDMQVAARGTVSWPCHSFMQLGGSMELALGAEMNFNKLHLLLTVQCQDPEAYQSESIFIIEVFEDASKMAAVVVRTYEADYAVFDNAPPDYEGDWSVNADGEAADYEEKVQEVVNTCLYSAKVRGTNVLEDGFWGASQVRGVYTRFEAEMELKKAQDHLAARKNVPGFQACTAKIALVPNTRAAQKLNEQLFAELGVAGKKFPPRKALELVAGRVTPFVFAGGSAKFTISNLLLVARAYDKPGARRAPAVQKHDIFPAMDLKYYDLRGELTASADVDAKGDAALAAAQSMMATSAALGQHGFSLAASATLNMTIIFIDAKLDFAWNLSVMMELSVATDAMQLHMRAAYDTPCLATGASASGTLALSMPGTLKIENAAVGGTLYCEGADPRVEAYVAIQSLVLAEVLELEDVRLDLNSVAPAGLGGKLNSLDWKITIAGTMRFDKLTGQMPAASSSGAVLNVDAELSVIAGEVTLDSLIVHFVVDVTYQGGNPAGAGPMLTAHGGADVHYPCGTGAMVHANLTVAGGRPLLPPSPQPDCLLVVNRCTRAR